MQYKEKSKSVPEIARELGADLIVEGAVVKSGDRIRVTAQLIDAARDDHLWAHSYDRRSRDVLALQAEVAAAIAEEVTGASVAMRKDLARGGVDPAAYDLYLRGRQAWNQRAADGYAEAVQYFTQSIEKDPTFPLAYAGLADAYLLMGQPLAEGSAPVKARAAAEQAVVLHLPG